MEHIVLFIIDQNILEILKRGLLPLLRLRNY